MGGVGWVGWGGWDDIVPWTCKHTSLRVVGWCGWDDKFFQIERKITSVVHSHPPSHYIRTHAFCPQHDCWWCLFTSPGSTNHIFWYIHMRLHKSNPPLHTYTRVFAHNMIADDVCSRPPFLQITSSNTYTCVSTYHIFSWKLFKLTVNFLLRRVTRILWCESHDPTSPLLTVLLGQHMPLFQLWNFPAIPVRRVFPWKKKRHPAGAGILTCEFTMTCEPKTHCTWENTMKVNLRNVAGFLRHAFSMKETRNVEAVGRESNNLQLNARRFVLEKTHGIWKGSRDARFSWKKIWNPGAVGRGSYEFTVTRDARRISPEKTQGTLGGLVERTFFTEKHTSRRGSVSVAYKFTIKMKPNAFYIRKHNDFSGSVADWGGGAY